MVPGTIYTRRTDRPGWRGHLPFREKVCGPSFHFAALRLCVRRNFYPGDRTESVERSHAKPQSRKEPVQREPLLRRLRGERHVDRFEGAEVEPAGALAVEAEKNGARHQFHAPPRKMGAGTNFTR